jgi:hypothetical protein
MGRAGVDDDEAVLLRERRIWAAVVVGLGSTSAEVDSYDDTRRRGELLWDIDEEACFGGRIAEACHLRQGAWCYCTSTEGGRCGDR